MMAHCLAPRTALVLLEIFTFTGVCFMRLFFLAIFSAFLLPAPLPLAQETAPAPAEAAPAQAAPAPAQEASPPAAAAAAPTQGKIELPKDFDSLKALAEKGNVKAEFELAEMYAAGNGTKQDFIEASKWYDAASKQGHVKSRS